MESKSEKVEKLETLRIPTLTRKLSSRTKEVLDSGDEDEKEKIEELTTEFEQLTEWLKEVLAG